MTFKDVSRIFCAALTSQTEPYSALTSQAKLHRPMNKLIPKIELVANLLIIVVAVLLIGVMVKKYVYSPAAAPAQSQRVEPAVGAKVNVPDVDWSKQPKTLILALQKGCHFCSESAPFYKRLNESLRNEHVQMVAVLPGAREESAAYLQEIGVTNVEVRQLPLNAIQVSGTPTLILTNEKGEVTHYWVGKLPPEKEKEVLEQLTSAKERAS